MVVAVCLGKWLRGTKPDIVTYEGGLSDRQIIQVTEYISEHLTQAIKTEDLAKFFT